MSRELGWLRRPFRWHGEVRKESNGLTAYSHDARRAWRRKVVEGTLHRLIC